MTCQFVTSFRLQNPPSTSTWLWLNSYTNINKTSKQSRKTILIPTQNLSNFKSSKHFQKVGSDKGTFLILLAKSKILIGYVNSSKGYWNGIHNLDTYFCLASLFLHWANLVFFHISMIIGTQTPLTSRHLVRLVFGRGIIMQIKIFKHTFHSRYCNIKQRWEIIDMKHFAWRYNPRMSNTNAIPSLTYTKTKTLN